MTAFSNTLESLRPAAIRALSARASTANKLAKTSTHPASRRLALKVKADALMALLRMGPDAASVVDISLATSLATVWVPAGAKCLHCPLRALDTRVRQLLLDQVGRSLNAA